jgi:type I restriction enzyme S subunit
MRRVSSESFLRVSAMRVSLGARHDFLRRYGVADNWRAQTLGDLARVVGGGTPSRDESRFWNGGSIPWATPTDLTTNQAKYISKAAECITDVGLASSVASLLPPGSILYTSRATIGAKAIANTPIATNQGFASFLPRTVDGEYLYYLLDLLTPIIRRLGAGTTFDEISKRDIRTVWCAVPLDSSEQAAIARILGAVDTALERTRTAVDRARQVKRAVLQRFFYDALGETAYADRPHRKLPAGWSLIATERLLSEDPKNGVSPEASSQPPGTPTFSIAAIRNGSIDLFSRDNLKYARIKETIAQRYAIRRGDVLIVRGNANPDLVGRAGMVTSFPTGCIYPDIVKRVVFRTDLRPKIIPDFGVLAWNHAVIHNQILRRAKTSNGTLKINNRDVKQIVMPVPPENEQAQIIRVTSAVDAQIDALNTMEAAQDQLKRALMHDLLTGRVRVKRPESAVAS